MKKKILFLFSLLLMAGVLQAADLPTVSTDEQITWYLLQFKNGGSVVAAPVAGKVQAAAAKGSPDQLWKLTGSEAQGYTFVNQRGLTLCVASAAKNQMLQAQPTATGVQQFGIRVTTNAVYAGHYEIHPWGNTAVALNLWGGPGANRGIGLWDKGDPNNVLTFVEASEVLQTGQIALIPYPASLTITQEGRLPMTALTAITYPTEEAKGCVEDFARQFQLSSGITLAVKPTAESEEAGHIRLVEDAAQPAEGYTLKVRPSGIDITASARAGFFYALQTLKQLLPSAYFADRRQEDVLWSVPYVDILDKPQLGYRGFMLDVARHFFTKEDVKRVLDVMALYKLNRFHWHLTDDQGWRIHMPQYPRLTEVGAVRSRSFNNPGEGGTQFFDDTEYGRGLFYTQDDLREIVAYAQARNIEILPEVDLPGHMVAAIAAYPEFSCDPTKTYEVRINSGISHDVLNVGDDKVVKFLEDVMDYLSDIFPYPYIHLGGDECPTEQWTTNAQCLERVRQHNLKGVEELQSWLVDHLGRYIKAKHGKDVVVWDELTVHWNKNLTLKPLVMAWNVAPDPGGKYTNRTPAQVAADLGFQSVYVPWNKLYVDWMQVSPSETLVDEPYHGGWGDHRVNSLQTVYETDPVDELRGREDFGVGVQANLWTETCNDAREMQYQLLPRLLALAETGWLPAARKNWLSFYRRLQSHDEILDALGYTYAKHFIESAVLTPGETLRQEADRLLAQSQRGAVGYPAAECHDALQSALAAPDDTERLAQALAAYKAAPILQPEAGKVYQIVSASTYYKRQFAGSTLYADGSSVRFHYTPQVEPEELWQFEPVAGGGYRVVNVMSGLQLHMPILGQNVALAAQGTTLRIDRATQPAGGYTYIPGVVLLSETAAYQPQKTGRVKRLNAALTGYATAADSTSLCYTGTWRLQEVTDFTAQLKGLVEKCRRILLTARPGQTGQPTEEALNYLTEEVITPAAPLAEAGGVTEAAYRAYAERYFRFTLMPRTTVVEALSEAHYYRIRNVWFPTQWATANVAARRVESKPRTEGDTQLWRIQKNADGTVCLYNKATQTAAYITSSAADQTLRLGKAYAWTLDERDIEGKRGVCILDATGQTSWYTNPAVWTEVLTKPFWGACTWHFEQTADPVPVGMALPVSATGVPSYFYDLAGRPALRPARGIYVTDSGGKVALR